MFVIEEDAGYPKKLEDFAKKHSDLKDKYEKTIERLKEDPNHPSLRLHKVFSKNKKEIYSISINMKYRILIQFIIINDIILLLDIGDHSIYKSL